MWLAGSGEAGGAAWWHAGLSPATPADTAGRQQNTAVITASEVADWRLEGPVRTVAF